MEHTKQILLERAVDINVRDEFLKKLESGKKLRIKFGIDPTGPVLHIGRASTIRQLKKFQDLGHTVVLIIGDFTGQIGDTSDKQSERQPLTREQIEANMANYKQQLGILLDINKAEFHYNSTWHDKLTFGESLQLAQSFTVAQMIERENYALRFEQHKPIGLHEFMYPLMQGYDSVAIKADVEIGGTDQLFNLMAGRVIQKRYGQTPQSVVTFDLLEGTDGRKMSTSWGNAIYITDDALSMYGKVMSITDTLIAQYYKICTDIPAAVITELVKTIAGGANPRDAKASLAREIVSIYHDEASAITAEEAWNKQFREGGRPDAIAGSTPIVIESANPYLVLDDPAPAPGTVVKDSAPFKDVETPLIQILVDNGLAASRSEARRLLEQGGVKLNDEKMELIIQTPLRIKTGDILQVGKRRYLKLVVA